MELEKPQKGNQVRKGRRTPHTHTYTRGLQASVSARSLPASTPLYLLSLFSRGSLPTLSWAVLRMWRWIWP